MVEELEQLPVRAREKQKENKVFFSKLKKKPPKNLDYIMRELHETEFRGTDCLQCANCCKTTGPLFTAADIKRVAHHLRMKPGKFCEEYLKVDEDKDYILRKLPCRFLGEDNSCSIYEVRPKACREFPHTDRKKFHQISSITLRNIAVCPAAFAIVEEMKKRIKL